MRKCSVEKNQKACTCSYEPCSRKGLCCECFAYHRAHGELPGCYFPSDVEKTYDRSIEKFVKTYQSRGPWWGK